MNKRTTRDYWWVETNWGHGWLAESTVYTLEKAQELCGLFLESGAGMCDVRITKHREKLDSQV